MKNKLGDRIAHSVTYAMATWTFIFFVLASCTTEIYGNLHGWFHFDPTMLVLNTILSLWAAVQGSIIMINQNQQDKMMRKADEKRDAMLESILKIQEHISNHLVGEESTLSDVKKDVGEILESIQHLRNAG